MAHWPLQWVIVVSGVDVIIVIITAIIVNSIIIIPITTAIAITTGIAIFIAITTFYIVVTIVFTMRVTCWNFSILSLTADPGGLDVVEIPFSSSGVGGSMSRTDVKVAFFRSGVGGSMLRFLYAVDSLFSSTGRRGSSAAAPAFSSSLRGSPERRATIGAGGSPFSGVQSSSNLICVFTVFCEMGENF